MLRVFELKAVHIRVKTATGVLTLAELLIGKAAVFGFLLQQNLQINLIHQCFGTHHDDMRRIQNFWCVVYMTGVGGFRNALFRFIRVGNDEMPRLRIGRGGRVLQQCLQLSHLLIGQFFARIKSLGGAALCGEIGNAHAVSLRSD